MRSYQGMVVNDKRKTNKKDHKHGQRRQVKTVDNDPANAVKKLALPEK